MVTPIDAILKDENAVLWRQDYTGKDHGFHTDIVETASSADRAALRAIQSAPAVAVIIKDGRAHPSDIVPSLHAVWPKLATLPHTMTVDCEAALVIRALADAAKALLPRGKNAKRQPRPYVLVEASGTAARVQMFNAPGRLCATVDGWTVNGPPIAFNPCYLADALQGDAADINYDSPIRPFTVINRGAVVGMGGYRTTLMPVDHTR